MDSFWPKIKENPIFALLLAVLLAVLIASLIFWALNLHKQNYYIGKSTEIQRTISISGEGKVTVIPDIAYISLGLTVEKTKVADAQSENTKTMNDLIDKLKGLGIDKKDIKTTSYSIYPNYDYPNNKQTLRSYTVYQEVQVKLRQTDKIDQVLKIGGDLNLNQIGGLSFDVDEPEQYRQEARVKALENAKQKADDLSKIMGVKLGKVVSFSEGEGYYPTPYPIYSKAADMGIGGGGAAPSVQSGSQDITITATVVYELD
jgi:uncharacterized protein